MKEKLDNLQKKSKNWIYIRWVLLRALIVLFDIVSINAAYFLTLYFRFNVAHEYHSVAGIYIESYLYYAPYYTLFCILIYAFFKLYSGVWKYAGVHDMRRVFFAGAVCLVGHVVGTLLFVRRMPISFYCIGALLQVVFLIVSRFYYRLLSADKYTTGGYTDGEIVNTMVIGTGNSGMNALQDLRHMIGTKPVCVVNAGNKMQGLWVDGIPVINGTDRLKDNIVKYKVALVILASSDIPPKMREDIVRQCRETKVQILNYDGVIDKLSGCISLSEFAYCALGKVNVTFNGDSKVYENGEQALQDNPGKLTVKTISSKENMLAVELEQRKFTLNDTREDWVKKYETETGDSISFF